VRDLVEGVLEDGGSKESLPVGESGKRGGLSLARAGRRSKLAVVLKCQRKDDGLPSIEGVALEGDGWVRSV